MSRRLDDVRLALMMIDGERLGSCPGIIGAGALAG
jgi:hypothetical protein